MSATVVTDASDCRVVETVAPALVAESGLTIVESTGGRVVTESGSVAAGSASVTVTRDNARVVEAEPEVRVVESIRQGPPGQDGAQGPQGAPGQAGQDGAPGIQPLDAVLLPIRASSDVGNGYDGRIPGVSCAKNATNGGYYIGSNVTWTTVDLWVAFSELASGNSGNVALRVYFDALVVGSEFQHTLLTLPSFTLYTVPGGGAQRRYFEVPVATGLAVANGPLCGTIVRYGADISDTYEDSIGIIGAVVREAA